MQMYGGFERDDTLIAIEPQKFAHRYFPLGQFAEAPCTATVLITNLADNSSNVYSRKISRSDNGLPKTAAIFDLGYSIESAYKGILRITVLLTSKATSFSTVKVTRKSLANCTANIVDGLIRQGMEGALVKLPPLGMATISTALQLDDSQSTAGKKCQLRFDVEDVFSGNVRTVNVPIRNTGSYKVRPIFIAH